MFANFGLGFRKVLIDTAFESPEFEAFKCEVERFFHEANPEAIADREEARRSIRAGQSAPWTRRQAPPGPAATSIPEVPPPPYSGRSSRPSAWRAKRPCSRLWTGASLGQGHPPNCVRW